MYAQTRFAVLGVMLAILGSSGPMVEAQVRNGEGLPQPAGEDYSQSYEVLTHGPIHEAFARPYHTEPVPGVVIEQQPPAPIEEIPPEIMPEGENVVWIPGYWGWDARNQSFVWVSGIWRDVPPGQRWVPGYWARVAEGYQWIGGFWVEEETEELVYLPYPPESLERGPSSPPPDGDYFWVPGVWRWDDDGYVWQPGFWMTAYVEWVWVPAHYVYTPYGCLFVEGYWDYRLPERGFLFAPVVFASDVYRQPRYVYSPSVVVNVTNLLVNLFVSPTYYHYYFGDYYGVEAPRFQLAPWYAYERRSGYHDHLLTYYQWYYARRNINLYDRLDAWHDYYLRNPEFRPPATLQEQRTFLARHRDDASVRAGQFRLARSVRELVRESEEGRFRFLERERRRELADRSRRMREFAERREELERRDDEGRRDARDQQPNGERRRRVLRLPERDERERRERPDRGEQRRPGERPPAGERPEDRREQPPGRQPGVTPPGQRPGDQERGPQQAAPEPQRREQRRPARVPPRPGRRETPPQTQPGQERRAAEPPRRGEPRGFDPGNLRQPDFRRSDASRRERSNIPRFNARRIPESRPGGPDAGQRQEIDRPLNRIPPGLDRRPERRRGPSPEARPQERRRPEAGPPEQRRPEPQRPQAGRPERGGNESPPREPRGGRGNRGDRPNEDKDD